MSVLEFTLQPAPSAGRRWPPAFAEGYGALIKGGGGGRRETMAADVIAKSQDLGKVSDRYFTSAKNRFAFSGMPGS